MKTTVIFFSDFHWHGPGFPVKNKWQDLGKKSKKSKIFATNKNIQDLGKKIKIIEDYPRSWRENQAPSTGLEWRSAFRDYIGSDREENTSSILQVPIR